MITKPKGTYDILGEDSILYNYIINSFDRYMNNYNYEFIRTPIFEATELYKRSVGDDSDIVSKETYDFKDRSDREQTLRPEGTAGVVRSLIENKLYGNNNGPIKLYYCGTMYRYERPQAGRYRELTQYGVEVFNSNDVLSDAEVISMGQNMLKEIGLEDISVSINTLGDKESRKNYSDALKKYLEPHIGMLCEDCQNRFKTNPLRILDCKYDKDNEILLNVPKIKDYLSDDSKNRYNDLKKLLTMLDVDYVEDDSLVRGLDYYDENVWEYKNNNGLALGGGGRYNHLVEDLGGPSIPAVGFAFGIDRLMLELKSSLKENISKSIDVYIMCISDEEKIHAITIAQDLRLNGIVCEINSNNLSMKSQFKQADNLKSKYIIILNNEDLSMGFVNIKDNITKEEQKIDENELVDYFISNL